MITLVLVLNENWLYEHRIQVKRQVGVYWKLVLDVYWNMKCKPLQYIYQHELGPGQQKETKDLNCYF